MKNHNPIALCASILLLLLSSGCATAFGPSKDAPCATNPAGLDIAVGSLYLGTAAALAGSSSSPSEGPSFEVLSSGVLAGMSALMGVGFLASGIVNLKPRYQCVRRTSHNTQLAGGRVESGGWAVVPPTSAPSALAGAR